MTKIAPSREDIQDLKMAEHMRDLINSPAWKIYEQLLQNHIEIKMKQLLLPLHPLYAAGANGMSVAQSIDGISHVLVGEASKGAIMGLRLALELPSGIVRGAEQIRKRINPSNAEVEI